MPEVNHFDVELRIQKDVFGLDITMRDPSFMDVPQSRDELPEDVPGCPFGELFGLVD